MGLLEIAGAPLDWSEAKKHADHVRKHGIEQFISIYNKNKDTRCSVLRWGDEVISQPKQGDVCARMHHSRRVLPC